jgi:hypothetical protein
MPSAPTGPPRSPREHYQHEVNACVARQRTVGRVHEVLGWARVAGLVLLLATAYQACDRRRLSASVASLPLLAFIALSIALARTGRVLRTTTDMRTYYEDGLRRLDEGWTGGANDGARFLDPEHPYALDLDLFGPHSLYARLCLARTSAGEETLAGWLLQAAGRDEVLARQEAVAELRGRVDLREHLFRVAGMVRQEVRSATALTDWLEAPAATVRTSVRVLAVALGAAGALAVVAVLAGRPLLAIPVAIAELAFVSRHKKLVAAVAEGTWRRVEELAAVAALATVIEQQRFTSGRLQTLQRALQPEGLPARRRIAELTRRVGWFESRRNPFFGLTTAPLLLGTQLAMSIEAWRSRHGHAVAGWIRAIAEVEALSSLATYAYEHPDDPFPSIAPPDPAEGPIYRAEGLAHPLIPASTRVANDVALGRGKQLLLVTGSNMSGKSTLLRTVGINAVMALAGGVVCARSLLLSPVAIGATLRTSDSLDAGVSRFFAEIKRVRTIVGMAEQSPHTLFLLDEIFHGTNSQDRLAGAAAILRNLVTRRAIGLVTSHDLALAKVAEDLAPTAENVHFEDQIHDGSLSFDYRLRPGVVTRSNALALMKLVGLPV